MYRRRSRGSTHFDVITVLVDPVARDLEGVDTNGRVGIIAVPDCAESPCSKQ